MRQFTQWGKVAVAAAIVVGAAPLARTSFAEQAAQPDQGSQHGQGTTQQGSQSDQRYRQDMGASDQGMQQQASDKTQTQGGAQTSQAQMVTASATVQKVDKAKQAVTLRDSQGQTFDVKVGPNVNLDRLKAGDRVNATYYEEVAMQIGTPGQAPQTPKATTTTTQRGGVTARQATLTAKIQSVDLTKNTVHIRGPQGKMHTLKVEDPDLQSKLRQIKPGDTVEVTYTQAVAVSIDPAT